MLYNAFRAETGLLLWIGVATIAGLAGYSVARRRIN
jgi:LPXTG-motif cell wall-anchored protein